MKGPGSRTGPSIDSRKESNLTKSLYSSDYDINKTEGQYFYIYIQDHVIIYERSVFFKNLLVPCLDLFLIDLYSLETLNLFMKLESLTSLVHFNLRLELRL